MMITEKFRALFILVKTETLNAKRVARTEENVLAVEEIFKFSFCFNIFLYQTTLTCTDWPMRDGLFSTKHWAYRMRARARSRKFKFWKVRAFFPREVKPAQVKASGQHFSKLAIVQAFDRVSMASSHGYHSLGSLFRECSIEARVESDWSLEVRDKPLDRLCKHVLRIKPCNRTNFRVASIFLPRTNTNSVPATWLWSLLDLPTDHSLFDKWIKREIVSFQI